ncbi:insulin-like growth factor II isoform X2 [Daphnia magna]|uniref:insulin-like growth factor II isoform X2 n=1 Tax=Daphnia magna TaxID=35525 RepID=UPI001E1BDBF7|nr:insulin-like growth factor II isoform X2 [Daphnia magna]
MVFRQILILWVIVSHYGSSMSYPNNSISKHYCGSSLSGALFSVCRKHGFVTHFTPRVEFNRTTRGIIEECCINPCTKDQLSQYCQKKITRISVLIKRYNNVNLKRPLFYSERSWRRKRSQNFVDTNKLSKSKRSPPSACTCGNRIHSARSSKNKRKSRKRSTKARQKKDQPLRPSIAKANIATSTTESQSVAEAQYIDDWTWNGDEEGLFSVKSH